MGESKLEKRFRIAELAGKVVEQKRASYQKNQLIPGSTKEALSQLLTLRQALSSIIIEGQSFQRVTEVLDLAKRNLETKGELEAFNSNISELNGGLHNVSVLLSSMNQDLTNLTNMLSDELSKQQTQRTLETETLTKLNKYLDDWV
jgi:hypothetical protein